MASNVGRKTNRERVYVYIYIETNWPRSLPLPLPPFYTPLFLLFRSFGFAYTCHEQSARVSEDRGKKGGRLLFPANFQFSRLDSIRRVRSVTGLSEQIHDDVVIERELISSSNRGRIEKKRERGGGNKRKYRFEKRNCSIREFHVYYACNAICIHVCVNDSPSFPFPIRGRSILEKK